MPLFRPKHIHRRHQSEPRRYRYSNVHPLGEHQMDDLNSSNTSLTSDGHGISLQTSFLKSTDDDSFLKEVAEKTNKYFIGKQEAEVEVLVDRYVRQEGNKDKALLHVLSQHDNEKEVQNLVNTLLRRGASPSTSDSQGNSALHYAISKRFFGVCYKFLEKGTIPSAKDLEQIQGEVGTDYIASKFIENMSNAEVRSLYVSEGGNPAKLSFHNLIQKNMQETILAVLDCFIEQTPGGQMTIYYNILEADENGRTPGQKEFNENSNTPFQIIAKDGHKALVYHDVVRLLIRRKWKDYASIRFKINSGLFLSTVVAFTYSVVTAVNSTDVLTYDTPSQVVRGVTELWTCLMSFMTLLSELNQIKKHKWEYWKDGFNWLDLFSSVLILSVLPLRGLRHNAQWQVLSVAFVLWTVRIFKYAAIFRQTGVHAKILWRIVAHDFPQFFVIFMIILLAYSGSFLLSLKGEMSIGTFNETSSFEKILFLGVRILTEADSVIEYTQLQTMSCIIMGIFLFTCCVILLNILIAQLTDTYQNVQQDAQRGLEADRAWIVARVELNSLYFGKHHRTKHYKESEDIDDIGKVLRRWECPPLNEMKQNVEHIYESLDYNRMHLLSMQNTLAEQEKTLSDIQTHLERLAIIQTNDLPTDNGSRASNQTNE